MSLLQHSQTFEQLVDFGLHKFGITAHQRRYILDIITTNKKFYSVNRNVFKDLISSIISNPITTNSFLDWFESVAPIYLKEDEQLWITNIESRITEIERKLDNIYDLVKKLVDKN